MMNTNRSIIVFSTWRSPILVPYLRALHEVGIPVASIVFDGERNERSAQIHRDRTRGFFEDESIFELEDLGIPSYFVKNHNAKPSTDLLGHLGPDIIINGGVPRFLKPQLLAAASTGVVNSHPGLLPKYRGATCLEWALRNDDPLGATCHFMNEEIDAGPIVYREEMPVYCGQPYEELRARIIGHSADPRERPAPGPDGADLNRQLLLRDPRHGARRGKAASDRRGVLPLRGLG